MNAHSYYGFGGAYAVALKNVDVKLDKIIEPGGFGLSVIEANREWLNFEGSIYKNIEDIDYSENPSPDLVVGNPPCSGFSTLNFSTGDRHRGSTSEINDCMWEIAEYTIRVRPKVTVFESVPTAYSQGLELMLDLWRHINYHTDMRWYLQLVKMSAASIGNPQRRHRFFWVVSQEPVGVTIPEIDKITTMREAVDDLRHIPLQDEPQVIDPFDKSQVSPYVQPLTLSPNVIDGHIDVTADRDREFIRFAKEGYGQRETLTAMVEANGYGEYWNEVRVNQWLNSKKFWGPYRVRADALARVVMGRGSGLFIHYAEDRIMTPREAARLMGFPDSFSWGPSAGSVNQRQAMLGKQVPVDSWTWMLDSIRKSLEGQRGLYYGKPLDTDVTLIDITHDYKKVYDERKRTHTDSRTKEWTREMESRVLS